MRGASEGTNASLISIAFGRENSETERRNSYGKSERGRHNLKLNQQREVTTLEGSKGK